MKAVLTDNQESLEIVSALIDKTIGYPKPGINIGSGKHVNVPTNWDGTGDIPNGWTISHSNIVGNGMKFSPKALFGTGIIFGEGNIFYYPLLQDDLDKAISSGLLSDSEKQTLQAVKIIDIDPTTIFGIPPSE